MANQTPPPVPTQSQMTNDQGLVTRPWLSWFTTLGQLFGFNQTIEANGVAMAQQAALNFLPPLTVTDNPANGSTDVGLGSATSVQTTFNGVLGQAYQNATQADKFVSVVANTPQDVGQNSAFGLYVGTTVGGMVLLSAGNVTNGPGYATVSGVVPVGSWYMVNTMYGSLAIVADGWQEVGR